MSAAEPPDPAHPPVLSDVLGVEGTGNVREKRRSSGSGRPTTSGAPTGCRCSSCSRRPTPRSPTPASPSPTSTASSRRPGYTTVEELAANLGVETVDWSVTVHMGGASPSAAIGDAAMAVEAGIGRNVLVVVGWNGYSAFRPREGVQAPRRGLDASAVGDIVLDYYLPYGARSAAQFYGWIATRHKLLYGTRDTDTGEVAVTFRRACAAATTRR